MNKAVLWLFIGVFSGVGSWLPTLWRASLFSPWSLVGSLFGSFFGIWAYLKLNDYVDG